MNRFVLFLPLIVFAVVIVFAVRQLGNDQNILPSAMIDKPVPEFTLEALPGIAPLTNDDLKGQVSLVSVFGSWCPGCLLEHPLLVEIKESGSVPIYGINWADTPERGAAWLNRHGLAYDKVGNDEGGRTVVDFGVTGAPETFVVDASGRIRYRHAGPLTRDIWEKTLFPMVQQLQAEAKAAR